MWLCFFDILPQFGFFFRVPRTKHIFSHFCLLLVSICCKKNFYFWSNDTILYLNYIVLKCSCTVTILCVCHTFTLVSSLKNQTYNINFLTVFKLYRIGHKIWKCGDQSIRFRIYLPPSAKHFKIQQQQQQ